MYTVLQNRILVEKGTNFGNALIHLALAANMEVHPTGIEAHSGLWVGERYHGPLRATWRECKKENPQIDDNLSLKLSSKAMNDTVGPEGRMPSALVFGEYPRVLASEELFSKQATTGGRAQLIDIARERVENELAKARVYRALKHSVPRAANKVFSHSDQTLVWREKIVSNRIGE